MMILHFHQEVSGSRTYNERSVSWDEIAPRESSPEGVNHPGPSEEDAKCFDCDLPQCVLDSPRPTFYGCLLYPGHQDHRKRLDWDVKNRDRILGFIRDQVRATAREIADGAQIAPAIVSYELQALRRSGRIIQPSRGVWAVPQ